MTTKVITGTGFEFRYDPSKMKAFLEMVEGDLAVIVLRWLKAEVELEKQQVVPT